jgi:hypothetical protein
MKRRVRTPRTVSGSPVVVCACGCGQKLEQISREKKPRRFINGHNSRPYRGPTREDVRV